MDSFFGIGSMELVVILVIAAIVMGPARIAYAARWLGKTTAALQKMTRGFSTQLQRELQTIDETGELKQALQDVRQAGQNLQKEVSQTRQQVLGLGKEAKQVLEETETAVAHSIAPPRLPAEANANGHTPPLLPKPLHIPDDE
jgi:sec-independent protein translocase protein TatB